MSIFDIHRTNGLVARAVTGHGSTCCVVTFEPLGHSANLDRQAFGQDFLARAGIDAVHVVPAANDWYQHADFPDLCRHVAAFTRRYERVVAYGSSMGGYAAVRFGGSVGAHQAFALSPQFSIDPRRVPFERRWADAARRLDFTTEAKASRFVDTAMIAYDPHDPDRHHVDLFRPHTEVVDIALPYCGHPSSQYLRELGLLQQAVLDLAADTFDATALRDLARARRKEAPAFYVALSRRARSDALALALAERAIARSSAGLLALTHFAGPAARAGRFADAQAALERAESLQPGHPAVRRAQAEVHERAGDLDRAIALVEGLCRDPLPIEGDRARLAHLKLRRRFALYRRLTSPATLDRLARLLERLHLRRGQRRPIKGDA